MDRRGRGVDFLYHFKRYDTVVLCSTVHTCFFFMIFMACMGLSLRTYMETTVFFCLFHCRVYWYIHMYFLLNASYSSIVTEKSKAEQCRTIWKRSKKKGGKFFPFGNLRTVVVGSRTEDSYLPLTILYGWVTYPS